MGFRDYYRQFEEMAPDEISEELLAARDERRRRALSRVDALDLSGTEWHEPPHPDAVNAATFALRRAVNAYPDRAATALREALAARHGVGVAQVAVGHGAGDLLRGALAAVVGGGARTEVLIAWPGWQPLPELVEAAGGRALPVPPAPAEILARAGDATGAVVLTSPADPTGALVSRGALRELRARLPEHVTVIVDEALGEFAPAGEDAGPLVAELPDLVVVRSFSKAHAMAGLRAGAALGPPDLVARLAPSGGISAPAQAAALWAASDAGAEVAARRRAAAAAAHERLAAALAGSPFSAAPGVRPVRLDLLVRRGRRRDRGPARQGAGLRRARVAVGRRAARARGVAGRRGRRPARTHARCGVALGAAGVAGRRERRALRGRVPGSVAQNVDSRGRSAGRSTLSGLWAPNVERRVSGSRAGTRRSPCGASRSARPHGRRDPDVVVARRTSGNPGYTGGSLTFGDRASAAAVRTLPQCPPFAGAAAAAARTSPASSPPP